MTWLLPLIFVFQARTQTADSVMRDAMKPSMPAFQNCFVPELKRDRKLEVKIKLKWVIDINGDVKSAEVIETTKKLPLFEGCMLNILKKIKFTSEGIDYAYEYTFAFRGQ